jgi:hypothetical protein
MDLTTDNQLHAGSPAARAGARRDTAARQRRRKIAQQSASRDPTANSSRSSSQTEVSQNPRLRRRTPNRTSTSPR